MLRSLYKDIIHFVLVFVVLAIFFIFTNCGEEDWHSETGEGGENYVYVNYRDGDGQPQTKIAHFQEADGDLYIDGDVLIGSAQEVGIGEAIDLNLAVPFIKIEHSDGIKNLQALKSHKARLWLNGEVPFAIHPLFSFSNERKLMDFILDLNDLFAENDINLQLVRRTTQTDYIEFIEKDLSFPMGGQSYIGRQGGKQSLKIREDNFNTTIVYHEIMHALGFKHEHQRSDRELEILFDNIKPGLEYNFSTYKAGTSIGDYDYSSIMHYHSFAFSKNGQPTMTKLQGDLIYFNNTLSEGDLIAIGEVYGLRTPLNDGYYEYSGRYFSLERSQYCEHKNKKRHLNYYKLKLSEVVTLRAKGAIPNLENPPFCN